MFRLRYFALHCGKNNLRIGEGFVNQNSATGWNLLKFRDAQPTDSTRYLYVGDTLTLRFHPNNLMYDPKQARCIADAAKFRRFRTPSGGSVNDTIVIKPSDLYDITVRQNKGFRLLNWYNRSFYDMQDDGGQSKVKFFEILGCRPGNFLYDDCIGLLYAMGHAGLVSVVNTVPTNSLVYFTLYTTQLGGGNNFGTSYRVFAQYYYPGINENFMLFGAGPLVASPY